MNDAEAPPFDPSERVQSLVSTWAREGSAPRAIQSSHVDPFELVPQSEGRLHCLRKAPVLGFKVIEIFGASLDSRLKALQLASPGTLVGARARGGEQPDQLELR